MLQVGSFLVDLCPKKARLNSPVLASHCPDACYVKVRFTGCMNILEAYRSLVKTRKAWSVTVLVVIRAFTPRPF
jgi:hypothetical protein